MPVYCITGTNRGIGLEFVRQLARKPENTIIATVRSLSGPGAADLADLKAAVSPSTHILECETGSEDSIKSFASAAGKALGGKKIDFLFNSAGINSHPSQTSLTLTEDAMLQQVRVNVLGPAKVVQHLLAAGLLAPAVRVMNLTSGLGSASFTLSHIKGSKCTGYAVSKAALDMLAVHQGYDLRDPEQGNLAKAVVIVMDPGWVKTKMGGEGSFIEPEESIRRMLECVHGLREEDNQKFYEFKGGNVGW